MSSAVSTTEIVESFVSFCAVGIKVLVADLGDLGCEDGDWFREGPPRAA
jgi:hypothetical protein